MIRIFTPTRTLLATSVALLAACSSTPITPPASTAAAPAPATVVRAPTAQAPAATAMPAPASTVATVTLPAHLDPKSAVSTQRSVYFDFDEVMLTADDSTVIERHGQYLAAHPAVAIRVEGNTDERGSPEYNLALGQKRAEVVLRALKVYGVKDSQLEAVSWGEEKPRTSGNGEAAWSQNRRADLQYPAK